jgi:hypothetical protein
MPSKRQWAGWALALAAACSASPRPAPTPEPSPDRAPLPRPTASAHEPPADCGELALVARGLEAEGQGEAHPERLAVERALAACTDPRPSASACQRVVREHQKLSQRGYGPRHPVIVASNARIELCRATFGSAGVPPPEPPTVEECASLPAERERLFAEGKGERHPLVLAVDAELAQCAAQP